MTESAEVQQVASEIITCRRIPFSAPQLVHVLVESKSLLATMTFDRLYAWVAKYVSDGCKLRLPRRIPFQVPSYSPALMSRVRTAALKHVNTLPFPTPVLRWFSTAMSILPTKTERIASVVRGYRNVAFNRNTKCVAKKLVPARTATVGDRPVLQLFTCGPQKARELLQAAMQPAKCTCNALMYLRLTWKCDVGAQLGLKELIWGKVVFFKGVNVKGCGFRGWVGVLECPQRNTNP